MDGGLGWECCFSACMLEYVGDEGLERIKYDSSALKFLVEILN